MLCNCIFGDCAAHKSQNEPCILFRKDLTNEEEFQAASKYFNVYTQRTDISGDGMVIGRYSVLPYYKELEQDIKNLGGELINSYRQHQFVADMAEWSSNSWLTKYTPETWTRVEDIPWMYWGPFVVKGKTNSRKHDWDKKMFVKGREDLGLVISDLLNDPLIADQGIVIRRYEPLETILTGLNGLPITMEFRVFICNGNWVDDGFYWSSYALDVKEKLGTIPDLRKMQDRGAFTLIQQVANIMHTIPDAPKFYTIDIAKKQTGEWILIELNDGQMAGLSEINPDNFYRLLKEALKPPTLPDPIAIYVEGMNHG